MKTKPLHPDFGLEITDFDILGPTPQNEIEELRRALDEHQLLLFRCGQELPPERQVEIASWFGPLQDVGDGRHWNVLDNVEVAGSYKIPFHMDFTFTDSPMHRICLHALEIPQTGGATSYVSNVAAWNALPRERQEELTGLTGRFFHVSPAVSDWPDFIGLHPVRFPHPRTGATALMVSEYHTNRIVELDEDKSDALLQELFAHLYTPERIYRHDWQLHDLVIWDNLSVQHARRTGAAMSAGRRRLRRVALHDETLESIVARARQQRAQEQLEAAG